MSSPGSDMCASLLTKIKFLVLDSIDNLPRMPISDTQMRVIIWALKECGAKDIPSFSAFRKLQKDLRAQSNISTRKFNSMIGNIFYVNDLGAIIAKVQCGINHF